MSFYSAWNCHGISRTWTNCQVWRVLCVCVWGGGSQYVFTKYEVNKTVHVSRVRMYARYLHHVRRTAGCHEERPHNLGPYITFSDFTKAFDTMYCSRMWKIVKGYTHLRVYDDCYRTRVFWDIRRSADFDRERPDHCWWSTTRWHTGPISIS